MGELLGRVFWPFLTQIAGKHAKSMMFLQKIFWGASPPNPPPGLRPWTPLGAAPPDPCRSLLASLAAPPRAWQRLASLAKSPPQRLILATGLVTHDFFETFKQSLKCIV